jgi:hypothetical protein
MQERLPEPGLLFEWPSTVSIVTMVDIKPILPARIVLRVYMIPSTPKAGSPLRLSQLPCALPACRLPSRVSNSSARVP